MFDDIRPYRDDEVVAVIDRLVNEPALQTSIAIFKAPTLYRLFPKFTRQLVKLSLKIGARKINCVNTIQQEVVKYLHRILRESTTGFTYHGLGHLDHGKPTLFISNHRDIVLDAALVNLALYQSGFSTVEAAVGDNLLEQDWVADLMRLNKSFVVKRSEKTKRAMLTASKQLSSYIHHTLTQSQQNIWLAQREGRAKDGLDVTNAALISMLLLNKSKQTSIADYLKELNIVPVSISYELDPCDKDKAIELAEKALSGEYKKAKNEDLKSITQGLVGQKGHVHIEFGHPIKGTFDDSKAIAKAIDEQIIASYKLYDNNIKAHQNIHHSEPSLSDALKKRIEGLTPAQQQQLLAMYANPVVAKEQLSH